MEFSIENHGGTPIAGWFINVDKGKSQSKMDDVGVPLFKETSICFVFSLNEGSVTMGSDGFQSCIFKNPPYRNPFGWLFLRVVVYFGISGDCEKKHKHCDRLISRVVWDRGILHSSVALCMF